MPFLYEKKQISGVEGIEILGYEGDAKKLTIPETIEGLPVLSLGKQAFTDSNKGLVELTLPKSINTIKAFSFYFCSGLHKINMTDNVEDYYDGAIRTSSGIRELEIEMSAGRYDLIRRIIDDSDRKLSILFRFPDHELKLLFPDFNSNSIADPRAQTFHIRIEGSGFSYRECVHNDGIRIKEYDSLYRKALSGDNPDIALEIAVARLQYPYGLSDEAAGAYRSHLTEDMDRALTLSVKPENEGWLGLFMKEELLDEQALDRALRLVSENKMAELAGELMDYRQKHFHKEMKGRLELDSLEDFDL